MIGYIQGTIISSNDTCLLILTNDIGYEVHVSHHTKNKIDINQMVKLYCHQVIREDANILYGFFDQLEQEIFRGIIKVSGVGPRLALTILSHLSPEILMQTVKDKVLVNLTSVPGIGKKSAERLLIELDGIFDKIFVASSSYLDGIISADSNTRVIQEEAMNALISLGFKQASITSVLKNISVTNQSSQDIIKQALRHLAK